jgi:glycosyltransferase involved in cell wall biosynthesis
VVYTGSAGVAAISSGLLDEIRSRYGFGGPAAVVPSAADTSLFRPLWSGGDGRTVAYCGTLQFWKGVGALLEALALSPGLRLLLVGDGEETERKALHAAIERLGLRERVTLAGRVPQTRLPALLSSAACAVHPSTDKASIAARFTSPMKVVEALALGLPVVASDLPSTRELLRHEENALLAPPGDAQALARALERLCRDRALARRLSQAGRQTAQDMTYDARARKLLALFALAGA